MMGFAIWAGDIGVGALGVEGRYTCCRVVILSDEFDNLSYVWMCGRCI